jgi:hypothetical protein
LNIHNTSSEYSLAASECPCRDDKVWVLPFILNFINSGLPSSIRSSILHIGGLNILFPKALNNKQKLGIGTAKLNRRRQKHHISHNLEIFDVSNDIAYVEGEKLTSFVKLAAANKDDID